MEKFKNLLESESLCSKEVHFEKCNSETGFDDKFTNSISSADTFATLYDHIPTALLVLNHDGTICNLNAFAVSMFDIPKEALVNKHFDQYITTDTLATFNTFIHEVFESKIKSTCMVMLTIKKGNLKVCLEGLINKENLKCFVTCTNITELEKRIPFCFENEENKYRLLIENISDLVCELDASGVFTYVSKNFEEILGYSPNELIGKDGVDLIHPEDLLRSQQKYTELLETSINSCDIWKFKKKNGEYIYLESKGAVYLNKNNEKKTVVISRDISGHKKAQNELVLSKEIIEKNEKRLKAAEKVAHIGNFEIDFSTNKKSWSEETFNIFGLNPLTDKEPTVDEFEKIIHKDDRKKLKLLYNRCISEQKRFDLVFRILLKDNSVRYVHCIGDIETDKQGTPLKMFGTYQDITERKEKEDALIKSEEKFRFITERANDLIYIYNLNPKPYFEYVSPASTRITGFTPEEFYNDPLVGIELVQHYKKCIVKSYFGKFTISKPTIISWKKKNGSIIWLEQQNDPIFDESGEIIGIQGISRDITERKQAEEALKESEARFRGILQSVTSVSVQGYNADGITQYWNKASENLYGYTEKEAVGRNLLDLIIPSEMHNEVKQAIKDMAKTGLPIPAGELSLMRRDGTRVSVYSSHTLVKSPDGSLEFFCIDIDLTELKKSQEKLLELNNQLLELNATKDKLFTIIAHDLRSPFTGILGFSDLLYKNIRNYDIEQSEKYIKLIYTSVKHTFNLVENLLAWANTQTGKIKFFPETFQLYPVVQNIINMLSSTADVKQISIKNLAHQEISIFTDKSLLGTILRNLISNAIKFTPKAGAIEVQTFQHSHCIEIIVKDNGIGIESDVQKKLFLMDNNYTTKGTENEKGSGLGLILCKEFVEKLGGEIWIESEGGTGTCFHFTVPNYTETDFQT